MLCYRNQHSVVGQLYVKNRLKEKEIRLVVTRGEGGGGRIGWRWSKGTEFHLQDK